MPRDDIIIITIIVTHIISALIADSLPLSLQLYSSLLYLFNVVSGFLFSDVLLSGTFAYSV